MVYNAVFSRRIILLILLTVFCSSLWAQRSIDEIHDRIKESQLADEKYDWKYFGTLNYEVAGTDNSGDYKLDIEAGTIVRMYLLVKTDCIPYFDIRDPQTRYVFGSNDKNSLETEIDGYKAVTAVYQYQNDASMVIEFGLRWGCSAMLKTQLKLLIFYQKPKE